MKLLMVDASGAIMQEYGNITAQVDGTDIECNVLKVVIPGETGISVECYDCGRVPTIAVDTDINERLCTVCATYNHNHGDKISFDPK